MKKSDLKTGMIVTMRLGERYVVMKDTLLEGDDKDVLINLRIPGSWMPLSVYNDDLICIDEDDEPFDTDPYNKQFDIINVQLPLNPAGITSQLAYSVKTIWTRGV